MCSMNQEFRGKRLKDMYTSSQYDDFQNFSDNPQLWKFFHETNATLPYDCKDPSILERYRELLRAFEDWCFYDDELVDQNREQPLTYDDIIKALLLYRSVRKAQSILSEQR